MKRVTLLSSLVALVGLFCLLCAPCSFAAGKPAAVTHRQLKDTGWNVCRDMVKNLDKLHQSDSSYRYEMRFHPDMPQFSEPEWEELKIEDYWHEVYEIEREFASPYLASYSRVGDRPFAEWREQYLNDGFSLLPIPVWATGRLPNGGNSILTMDFPWSGGGT